MIRVRVKRAAHSVTGITVTGHAHCAPKGEDIICAAVSALVQTFLFSLQRLLRLQVDADIRDGYFSLELPAAIPDETREKASLLAESMLVGLEEIDLSYPGFIAITEVK